MNGECQDTDLRCGLLEYVEGDYAIVQSPDWSTLFILSREQNVTTDKIDVSQREFIRDCRISGLTYHFLDVGLSRSCSGLA